MQTFSYKVRNTIALTKTITQLFLQPNADHLSYQAGQYIEALFPDASYQPFSIANAPSQDKVIELHVRHLHADTITTAFLEKIKDSKQITLRGALGNAYYRDHSTQPLLLLAGGTGFAYCKAIIEQVIANKENRAIHLFWGVKSPNDFYLQTLLEQWQQQLPNFHYTPMISQTKDNPHWLGKVGYVHTAALAEHSDFTEFEVYASGPGAMINAAWELFQKQGLLRKNFYSDML
jgi:CDP-4-dehydro-6-deoxyglucose reductase